MYHPYFRGKQYELITIRESAPLLHAAGFVPIIEPVKQSLGALQKTLSAVRDVSGKAIVVANPFHGDHSADGESISKLLSDQCGDYPNIIVGVLLKENTNLADVITSCETHASRPIALIHAGYANAKELVRTLGPRLADMQHIFFDGMSGKLYQKHFADGKRVLLRDGFQRRRNRDHPDVEFFSDLHATFADEGMAGFGDFLIVGDDYIESGGPAYAVAIHLTFIDDQKDDEMHIFHFKSDRQDTPTDPAGKFAEALQKLIDQLGKTNNKIRETRAIIEFRELHRRGHFPGLGYIKKLSMKHHIETLALYFAEQR
ncbi:MAG: sce7725 family protein [Beijerinckiaceae bacterium]